MAVLSACSATGPIYQSAPAPSDTDALVYIYRPEGQTLRLRDSYFYVNGINIADLSPEGYTWFHVPAGSYSIKQSWPADISPWEDKSLVLPATWRPGQTYYYRLYTWGGHPSIMWTFSEVPAETALQEIKYCKLQPAFGIETLKNQLLPK